jgi:hypothetical protein
MEVCDQLHTPTALLSGKETRYPLDKRLCGPQSLSGHGVEEKNSQSPPGIKSRSDIQLEVSHYTDEATPALRSLVLRRISGGRMVTGGWRRLHNELHNFYASRSIVTVSKSRRMRWAGHVTSMGGMRNAYNISVGKPEGKIPL